MKKSKQHPRLLVAALISKSKKGRFPDMLLTQHEGSDLWHFPDGKPRFLESFVDTLNRSLQKDIGVIPAEIDERNRLWLTTLDINPDKRTHIVTMHFIVRLPVDEQILSGSRINFMWFPMDPRQRPSAMKFRPSTAEIIRRLDEDKK